jgi:hypothetical protein
MVAGQTGSLEVVGSVLGNVRFGSNADIEARQSDVRFTTESGRETRRLWRDRRSLIY